MSVDCREVGCRVCGTKLPPPFLDLGVQPPANNLEPTQEAALAARRFPLALSRCENCQLVSLTHVVDPELLFSHYLYATGVSASFRAHFAAYAESLSAAAGEVNGLAVDVGSNDGILLSEMRKRGWRILGVDPAKNLVDAARAAGIPTVHGFWSEKVAEGILERHGPAKLITANNVFAHLHDVHDFVRGVKKLLADDGEFVFEVVSLEKMLESGTFDLAYGEHVSTWSATPLVRLFSSHCMYLARIDDVPSHGGSLRCWARKGRAPSVPDGNLIDLAERCMDEERTTSLEKCNEFAIKALAVRAEVTEAVRSRRQAGKRVVGYGAPAKATVLANYCGFSSEDIEYIVDDNPLKAGKFMPGTGIPIVSSEALDRSPPATIIVFPWNVAEDILPKLKGRCLEAVIPLPVLRTVGCS